MADRRHGPGIVPTAVERGWRATASLPNGQSSSLESLERLVRDPAAMVGAGLIFLAVLAALLAPVVAPYDPDKIHAARILVPPSPLHPLGTDELGRDLLSRVLWGARVSLPISL